MGEIISTDELKDRVIHQIEKYFPDIEIKGIYFKKGGENSPEGIYIFSEKGSYCIFSAEKGRVKEEIKTQDLKEILYFVLNNVIFEKALKFAIENREEGKDFRRRLFSKELELFLQLDRDFYNKKKREIEIILREHPYMDNF